MSQSYDKTYSTLLRASCCTVGLLYLPSTHLRLVTGRLGNASTARKGEPAVSDGVSVKGSQTQLHSKRRDCSLSKSERSKLAFHVVIFTTLPQYPITRNQMWLTPNTRNCTPTPQIALNCFKLPSRAEFARKQIELARLSRHDIEDPPYFARPRALHLTHL